MPVNAKATIEGKVREIAERVGGSEGIEIVDVQLLGGGKARTLRIFIDKPEGVSHADCELISQHVGTILDVEDVIPGGSYHLEVSSPGVERPLRNAADFQRFTGKKVKIVLREPVEERKHWEGLLASFENGVVNIEAGPGHIVSIPIEQVSRANLKFEW